MKTDSTWIDGVDDAHLKRLLEERASRHRSRKTLATDADAAPAFVFLRPPCKGEDCPDPPPNPPKDPCRGQGWVWQPDLAARLVTTDPCPSPDDLARLQQVVGGNLSHFKLPDPDVRASCNNGVIDILIWGNKVPANSCSDQARTRARVPDDIAAGGSFGVYINASLIRSLAHDAFDAAPKRLYANGFAGPDGPIHLTGLGVAFQSPNIVKTIITGFDDRPWPDVGFTTTITDTLDELRVCTTAADTEPSRFDEVLAALFAGVTLALTIYIPVLMPLPAFVLWTDLQALDGPDNPSDGGAGCRLMEALPDQIPLPQTGGILPPLPTGATTSARLVDVGGVIPRPQKKKIVIPYNRPRVDESGIKVSALATKADRVPAAHVAGPASLLLDVNAPSTYGVFGAHVEDFYGKLAFSWTASGPNAVVANPTSQSTKITFQRGNMKPGDHVDHTVTVKVTDVEGSTATASLVMTVFAAEPGESLPPVCKVKPWLDICSPGD
jgi:hypothetical protein